MTSLHPVGVVRRLWPAARLGCRFCGLPPHEHGVQLIHRYVRPEPLPANPGAVALAPASLAA